MSRPQHEERIGRTVTVAFAKRSCLDKKRFDSANKARDTAARMKKRHGWLREPYRCTLCDGWHLRTAKPEPERKRA